MATKYSSTCTVSDGLHFNTTRQEQFSDLSRFRNIGATAIAKLAKKCAARYHFSALEGFFFERPPYTTTVNDRPTCTRFLALAPISDSKEKSAKVRLLKQY
jgi:hypothetical protein